MPVTMVLYQEFLAYHRLNPAIAGERIYMFDLETINCNFLFHNDFTQPWHFFCALGKWGCLGIRTFVAETNAVMTQAEVTDVSGLTKVQVARLLDFLAEILTVSPRHIGRKEAVDQQLGTVCWAGGAK